MPYYLTRDEKRTFYDAGDFDAPANLNYSFLLAEDIAGYGFLTDQYILGDKDVYSLGSLSSGYYSVDVDNYTWDYSEIGYGSVSKFEVLDSLGAIVATSYSVYSDINFTVNSAETYYVKITGSTYSTRQYKVEYSKTGELVISNTPAVFSNGSLTNFS